MIGIPLMIVGCTKATPAVEVAPDSQDLEMSFSALTKGNSISNTLTKGNTNAAFGNTNAAGGNALTKGFVTGSGDYTAFVDIADPSETGATGEPRTIRLSAWNSTKEADYFIDKKFSKGTTDNMWHANPKIYYPLGCEVDLLGYSSGDTIVAEWQTAHVVKLQVVNTQDDILYSSATASSKAPIPTMTFHHSQAWIQFKLKANIADAVRVDSIYWENVYKKGELRLEYNGDTPKADWNFFTQDLGNVGVDDPRHKLDTMLKTTEKELNMLLPEQPHGSFVILYTLKNRTEKGKQFAYRVDASSLATTEWERSHKYTYTVNFEMTAITLDPFVNITVNEQIDRMNSIDLIEGIFTTSSGKVLFSKGNLQYRASDSTWRFAEHQYDWVGTTTIVSGMPVQLGSVKNSDNVPMDTTVHPNKPMADGKRKLYNGWIDLFGWGTSGIENGTNHCKPWETATNATIPPTDPLYLNDYGPSGNLDADSDWGKNIRVYEYNTATSFRTLSSDDWMKLINDTDRMTAGFEHTFMLGRLKYGVDTKDMIGGLFLFPDNFIWKEQFGPMPRSDEFDNFFSYLVDNTVGGRWDAMEYAGVVFIPCAGQRGLDPASLVLGETVPVYVPGLPFNATLTGVDPYGLYIWTSDKKCLRVTPIGLTPQVNVPGHLDETKPVPLAFGCSVRLVTDWPAL